MPKEIAGEIFYDIDEITEILKITPAILRDYINQDKLTAKKIEDEWLISEEALREFLDTESQQKK
jgi:hypothetical protein